MAGGAFVESEHDMLVAVIEKVGIALDSALEYFAVGALVRGHCNRMLH